MNFHECMKLFYPETKIILYNQKNEVVLEGQVKDIRKECEKYHNVELDPKQLIIFADRDKSNMSKENLLLVDNNQLLVLNHNKLINEDAELTKVGVNVANLIIKIKESKKKLSE